MAGVLMGPLSMALKRDDNGYRTYTLKLLIRVTDLDDGVTVASNAPSLPRPGDPWLIGNDIDVWVWCRPDASITRHASVKDGHTTYFYIGEFTYSNKPLTRDQAQKRRGCHEQQIEDPLLEPDRTSGGFKQKSKEATHNQDGTPILNSAHEVVRGPQVEFDESRPTVHVVQNRPLLEFGLLCRLIDGLNDAELWGFPPRWVKFSNATWQEQYHGLCYRYYTRELDFEVREDWDRNLLDEGTKVLNGHWGDGGAEGNGWVLDDIGGADPDPDNPSHFIQAIDRKGDPTRLILNGEGLPATNVSIAITDIVLVDPQDMRVTCARAHGLAVGDEVTILGTEPPDYWGIYTVITVPSTTTFTCLRPVADPFEYEEGGTLFVPGTETPGSIHVAKYRSVNLLQLGIPLIIGP